MKPVLLAFALALSNSGALLLAGELLNLDFENPDLSHVLGSSGPTAQLLRGWTLTREDGGRIPATMAISPVEAFPMSLTSARSIPTTSVDFGKYSLFLGETDPTFTPSYRLSQNGLIPSNAQSLVFYIDNSSLDPLPKPEVFLCLVNGKTTRLESGSGFGYIYHADVSSYAGQEVNLEFVFGRVPRDVFDIAGFTTVPEPSTYALFGVGAGLIFWHLRRRQR